VTASETRLRSDVALAPLRAAPDPDVSESWARTDTVIVVVFACAVLGLGFWRLGRLPLTADEGAAWAIAGHGFGQMVDALRGSGGDLAAGLYYAVLWSWIRAFGTSELALRSLSVLAAGATVLPFYALGRRLGRTVAVAATVLLGANPVFLGYARTARAYSLATFLVVLSCYLFVRAVEAGNARSWTAYTLVSIAAVYVHWFAALVLLAQFAGMMLWPRSAARSRYALRSGAALVAGLLPIALLVALGKTNNVGWIAPLNWGQVELLVQAFVRSDWWPVEVLCVGLLVVAVGATLRLRRTDPESDDSRLRILFLAWLVVPVAVALAVSFVKPLLIPRYLIVALPASALVLAIGLAAIASRSRWVGLGALVALLAAGVSAYQGTYAARHSDEDWRTIAATVGAHIRPGDSVIVYPANAAFPFAYYARDWPALARRGGPDWPAVSWSSPFGSQGSDPGSVLTAGRRLRSSTVWLVMRTPHGPTVRTDITHPPALEALRRDLAKRYPYESVPVGMSSGATAYVVVSSKLPSG
jgi:mannosyltransferase